MNHRWRLAIVLVGVVCGLAATAQGNPQITPTVTLAPTLFAAGHEALLFGCISNANPDSRRELVARDIFTLTLDPAGVTVTELGPFLVDSTTLRARDFTAGFGATANEVFITYVGASKGFPTGDTVCLQLSVQASSNPGPFEVTLDGPGARERYNPSVPSLL